MKSNPPRTSLKPDKLNFDYINTERIYLQHKYTLFNEIIIFKCLRTCVYQCKDK